MSKVRCFNYHEMEHYVTNCPSKKFKKGSSKESEGEALPLVRNGLYPHRMHGVINDGLCLVA